MDFMTIFNPFPIKFRIPAKRNSNFDNESSKERAISIHK